MLPKGRPALEAAQRRFPLSRPRPERLGRRAFPRPTSAVLAALLPRAERRLVLLRRGARPARAREALTDARFLAAALTVVAPLLRRGARSDAGAPSARARRRVTSFTSPAASITRSRPRAR